MAERAAMRPEPQGQGATGSHKRRAFGGCGDRMHVTSPHSDVVAVAMDGNGGILSAELLHSTKPVQEHFVLRRELKNKKLVRSCVLKVLCTC